MERKPLVSQGLFIIKAWRPHSTDRSYSAGLLWTSDHPDAQTSTWQHTKAHRGLISVPSAGFKHSIPASERPQTHALDCTDTGIGDIKHLGLSNFITQLQNSATQPNICLMVHKLNTDNVLLKRITNSECLIHSCLHINSHVITQFNFK
jgi:hypothetical protein